MPAGRQAGQAGRLLRRWHPPPGGVELDEYILAALQHLCVKSLASHNLQRTQQAEQGQAGVQGDAPSGIY
jgi:hypothetical protein